MDLIEDFCNGITFQYLLPQMAFPENLRLPVSKEFANVKFPQEDEQIKRLLLNIAEMPRMSSLAIGGIIHWLVRQMPSDCRYVNVGVWHGFTLFAGMLGNPDKLCVGVDNFTQFGGPRDDFLTRFSLRRSMCHDFHDMDYREYFARYHQGWIGLYYYDGDHTYAHQLEGLRMAEPWLRPESLILVDDTNLPEPRQATMDFMTQSPNAYRIIADLRTAGNCHPTFWNGLMILQRQ